MESLLAPLWQYPGRLGPRALSYQSIEGPKGSPQVGDKFDPQLHEAMFEAPVPGTKSGDIIEVSSEGFVLHDRLLRPAHVGVSSNS